jgi:hypothetical protein
MILGAQIPSSTIRKRREKRRLQWAGEPLSLSIVLSLSNCCCGSCTAITNVCAFALHDEFLVRIGFYFLFKYSYLARRGTYLCQGLKLRHDVNGGRPEGVTRPTCRLRQAKVALNCFIKYF